MITVPRGELFRRMEAENDRGWSFEAFETYLGALLAVDVPYVQGVRRNSFYIHE